MALLRALERRRDGGGDGGDEPPPPLLLRRLRGISFNAELGYLVVALEPGGDIVSSEEMIGGLDPDPRALREAVLLAEEGVSSSGGGSGGRGGSGGSVSGVIVTSLAATDDCDAEAAGVEARSLEGGPREPPRPCARLRVLLDLEREKNNKLSWAPTGGRSRKCFSN